MSNKNIWEGFVAALIMVLAVLAIREFFRNDRNQLISARGRQVLGDPELMVRVNKQLKAQLKEHEKQERSGPVVVNLN
ncbi:MAG TPA: hypothetical protein PLV08_14945 [Flavobacteriales bacterium]|nr:hypothetical protein [Flavobacteriales bacterium]